ncbi:MAG: hypothetical protein HYX78_10080 [Armatimonadetes bacterium]|nr:hypothetical protein [Armatimonadota bacterium]
MSYGPGLQGFDPIVVLQFDNRDRKGNPAKVVVADPRREPDWSKSTPVAMEAIAWTAGGLIIGKYAYHRDTDGKWTVDTSYWAVQPGGPRKQIPAPPADLTEKRCKERASESGLSPDRLKLCGRSPDGKFCLAQKLSSPESGSIPEATYIIALQDRPRFVDLTGRVKCCQKDVTTGLSTAGVSAKVVWLVSFK